MAQVVIFGGLAASWLVWGDGWGEIVLGAAGVSLADGNWPGLALAAALGALFWGKSGFEEGRLLAHFPAYAAYRDRVKHRLIPWVL